MRPEPVLQALGGGLTRRRVQTIVITVVVLVSTGTAVLGLALAIDSSAPFSRAFAAQRGADGTAAIDPSLATPAELAATTRLPQVTAAAGPYAEATVSLTFGGTPGCRATPGHALLRKADAADDDRGRARFTRRPRRRPHPAIRALGLSSPARSSCLLRALPPTGTSPPL